MNLASKRNALIILGLTAIFLSRALFVFFDDPEGPNLFVVLVATALLYVLTLAAYFWYPTSYSAGPKKLAVLILLQLVVVAGMTVVLR